MLKEIVTKAVISKGKIVNSNALEIDSPNEVNRVIGCWIINHNYISLLNENKVCARGYYDIHIWCAINDSSDTILLKQTSEYLDEFVMDNLNFDKENSEYKLYCINYPNCSNLQLKDNKILVTVDKGLAIDVIGESRLLVQVSDNDSGIEESVGINPNFIKK